MEHFSDIPDNFELKDETPNPGSSDGCRQLSGVLKIKIGYPSFIFCTHWKTSINFSFENSVDDG